MPVGIISCSGKFEKGDLISCFDDKENEIALGLTNFSSQELQKVIGL
ncbi:MAG: hypothetical protein Ct9H90mP4_10270 [Gammaproteobacteria bacterium]|nr:MAG: hypothetical protein Ct9H90mP4_10270 [Gammaproteobacteria bacterium]